MKQDTISGNEPSQWIKWATGWAVDRRTRMGQVISRSGRLAVCAIGVSTLILAASPAGAFPFGEYRFTEVNNTRGPFSSIGTPSINDGGTIAAVYGLDTGVFDQQVRTQTTVIADNTDPSQNFTGFYNSPIVNNSGTVVFEAQTGSSDIGIGIYANAGGLITTIVDDSESFLVDGKPIDFLHVEDFDFSDSGEVVFVAGIDFNPTAHIGVFGRNVAGGPVYRRTTDANFHDFGFDSPAVNSGGDFVWLMTDGCCGEETRRRIDGSFGTIMDTDDEFDIGPIGLGNPKRHIDMNNAGSVAFRAHLESGDEGIFVYSDVTGDVTTFVDTSGPFNSVRFPSISNGNTVAFLATLDAGGGQGIFRGPNPATDKIIAVGDIFQPKTGGPRTVTAIRFGNDSVAKLGKVAFTVTDQFGEEFLISGGPGLLADPNSTLVAQITTATDEKRAMSQEFTFPSFSPTQLMFDYRILTLDATLIAYVNDIEVGRVDIGRGTQPMEDFASKSIPVDAILLSGDNDLPEVLKLELVGGAGNTIQLDNIRFSTFNLTNGDFSSGDLTGWQFDSGAGSVLVTNGVDLIFVPEYTGDFNGNSIVDAADYVAWRKTDGTPQGYDTWQERFGETISSGSASETAVPEPGSLAMLIVGILGVCSRQRDRVAKATFSEMRRKTGGRYSRRRPNELKV